MPVLPVPLAAIGILLAVAAHSLPARAEPDASAIAKGLAEAIEAVGNVSVTHGAAAVDGEAVSIEDFEVTFSDSTVVAVPRVVLTGIVPREAGGFTAERIDFNRGTVTAPARTLVWADAAVEDVVVPTAEEVRSHPKLRPFRALAMTAPSLTGDALPEPIAAADVSVEVQDISEESPTNILVRATAIRLPASLLANSIVGVIVGMLNYSEFVADLSLDAVYDTAADTASMDALTIDVATVGRIDMAAKASNFSVRAITDPDEEVAKAARAAARLETLTLRIDNAGFVERVLDMQAAMLGGTRDDVRAQIVDGALPFALSFVKNEAFRAEFRAAIAAFLADPRSLTIIVQPDEPLPLGQVARTAARSPMSLPDLLNPTVQANN